MTYCGAIGSVNVLEFMSTDLFDESQENPFLLQAPLSASPTKQPPLQQSTSHERRSLAAKAFELPLHDPQTSAPAASPPQSPHTASSSTYHYKSAQSPAASPTRAPSSPNGRASVTFVLPKSILKRQSSYTSDVSTAAASDQDASAIADDIDVPVSETELHKLLYSLARFSVASESSVSSYVPDAPPLHQPHQPQRQDAVRSQPASPSAHASSLWLDRTSSRSHEPEPAPLQCHSTSRASLKSRSGNKAKPRSKSADRAGYATDTELDCDDDGDYGDDGYAYDVNLSPRGRAMRSRASVSFETVKNLLRGGGAAASGRTSRIVQRTIPDLRRKSMGTVSSRLKCRQKFARPTILTDAYHRVNTMKLGTKPMPVKVKHLAFPELHDPEAAEGEADPGMPSPKGQLRAASLVLLETLDKIGTRAACPVHLIDEDAPDYSNVPARVDSYNRIAHPSLDCDGHLRGSWHDQRAFWL